MCYKSRTLKWWKRLVSEGIPVPICYLLSKEGGLGSKAGKEELQVVN